MQEAAPHQTTGKPVTASQQRQLNLIRRLSNNCNIIIMTLYDDVKKNAQISLKTVALSFCFLAAGMSSAIVGPTLLDLQTQTATTLDKISLVLTSRSLGLGVGALLCE
jgi:aryl-alcohol dehydrogenase-like predicted oxidoreductase